MADVIYNSFFKNLADNNIDLDADTFGLMLVTSSYTPNVDADVDRADVTNEVSGTGYTTGGATVANTATTQDDTNDLVKFDGDDVTWSGSSITARGAVLYKDAGAAANDLLVKYFDFGSDQTSVSANFTVQFGADGILTIGNAA